VTPRPAKDQPPTIDRINRLLLLLLGLVLLGGAIVGLIASYGGLGEAPQQDVVLSESVREFFGRHGGWLWAVLALLALLIAYVGYRWLRSQLATTPRIREIDLTQSRPEGRRGGVTVVDGVAASRALAEDIERAPGVLSSSARLIGEPDSPVVVMTVEVDDAADVGAVRRRIEEQSLERLRSALEWEGVPAELRVVLAGPPGRRVR
jgi:hypothetical protein